MDLTCLLLVVSTLVMLCEGAIYSPLVAQRKHGPLYEGVQLLIADEQLNAALIWDEAIAAYNEVASALQQTLDDLERYNATVQAYVRRLGSTERPDVLSACLKLREREIARFNRELIVKYAACRRRVDATLLHLKDETHAEMAYVQEGEREIGLVGLACNASVLRRNGRPAQHAGVVLCIVSRIGQIDQRLRESADWCLDVVMDIGAASDAGAIDRSAGTCDGFDELRSDLDVLAANINECVREDGERTQ